MRSAILICLLIPVSLSAADKRPVTVDDLLKIRNVGETWISPDGESVVYVLTVLDAEQGKYNSDLWMVRVKDKKTWQLTRGAGRDDTPRWSPDGKTIAFISDRSGKPQIWLLPVAGGEPRKLTDHATAISDMNWSPDGKSIVFLAPDDETEKEKTFKKERGDVKVIGEESKMSHLHLIEVDNGRARRLTSGALHVTSLSVSPDGKRIAYTTQASPRPRDGIASDLHLLTMKDSKSHALIKGEGMVIHPRFSPSGKTLAFIGRLGKPTWLDSAAIWAIKIHEEEPEVVHRPGKIGSEYDNFRSSSPQSFAWSRRDALGESGGRLFLVGDTGTNRHLHRLESHGLGFKQMTRYWGIYDRISISTETKGLNIALVREKADHPPDIFLWESEEKLQRLTEVNPQVKDWALGEIEVVRWTSKDGLKIEGLLVKPVGYKEGTRYPMLTYVHGGPALHFAEGFSVYPPGPIQASRYPVQVFAGQGYAVFCPNPRGSTAYGEEFRKANIGDWGGKDFEDIMTGVDFLIDKGIADPERLGIMGWSYGGYMTNWAITQTNRFKAASTGAGLSNLAAMYGHTDIPNFMENYFGGPPWEKKELYEKRSPLTFIKNVKTPTLIQFGAQDERVPLAQGQELHAALKRLGVPVEFATYPRQGHNVMEPKLQRDVMTRNVEWFKRWLKK